MKWIIIVLAVAIIAGGAWFLLSGNDETVDEAESAIVEDQVGSQAATDANAAVATTTVTYSDDGFVPSIVGPLPVGTTVTFVNDSSSDKLRVASNPHPVHTDLNGFDSLGPIPVGESYSFTFDDPGEWGFHNHFSTSQTGTVVIE